MAKSDSAGSQLCVLRCLGLAFSFSDLGFYCAGLLLRLENSCCR